MVNKVFTKIQDDQIKNLEEAVLPILLEEVERYGELYTQDAKDWIYDQEGVYRPNFTIRTKAEEE